MADQQSGKWRTTADNSTLVEKGLQPARVQYVPPVRPASSQMQPPPPPAGK
jgi:hypothetical protein